MPPSPVCSHARSLRMPSVFLDFAHRSPRRLRRVRFAPSVFVSEASNFPSPPRRVRFNLPVSEASTNPSPLRRVRFNVPVSIVSTVSTVPPLSCLSKSVSAVHLSELPSSTSGAHGPLCQRVLDGLPNDPCSRPLSKFHSALVASTFDDFVSADTPLLKYLLRPSSRVLSEISMACVSPGTDTSNNDVSSEVPSPSLSPDLSRPIGLTYSSKRHTGSVEAVIDSGADTHIWSVSDATRFFTEQGISNLNLQGVSGSSRADLLGHLVIDVANPATGTVYRIDCGVAHGASSCPVNLLSLSLLVRNGAIAHFEHGNCYFQPHSGAERIPFIQRDGLFRLRVDSLAVPEAPSRAPHHAYVVNGRAFATAGDIRLWHRRVRHMDPKELLRIHDHELVRGFKLRGRRTAECDCDSCKQAKIRRWSIPNIAPHESAATFLGHTVSSDVKVLPYRSFRGYGYCVNFVDHFSRLGFVYMLKSKDEVTSKLRQYVDDMRRLGIKVLNLQTDRGSEYFSQEGHGRFNEERTLHEFDVFCASAGIRHVVKPVEMKERIAESWFKEHFAAVNAMLWDARLSPAFWADALDYSQFLWNHIPNKHLGGNLSPWQAATGQREDWSKFRVFGCDVYAHRPNNEHSKVPGIPRGQKLIFVGFHPDRSGFKCFDPETRQYKVVGDCYFYEDFSSRINALRHYDSRRALLKTDLPQPVVMDDFDDVAKGDEVRGLFIDPDSQPPPLPVPIPHVTTAPVSASVLPDVSAPRLPAPPGGAPLLGGVHAPGGVPAVNASRMKLVPDDSFPSPRGRPASPSQARADRARREEALRAVLLRPLRLLPIGKETRFTAEDQSFLRYAEEANIPVSFLMPCPKSKGSAKRYERYMHAKTMRQAMELGATRDDIRWDYSRGFIKFPRHEPQISGHVFDALSSAHDLGYSHILEEVGLCYVDSVSSKVLLGRAFNSRGQQSFQHVLETVFEPEVIAQELENRALSLRWAEFQASKVYNSATAKIDLSLAPEPQRYRDVLPAVCEEHQQWKDAMDLEMSSMAKFGVFLRVPRSAARGHQILGNKWVYRRKIGKDGFVNRWRARLVAQGFRQKPFDSYQPDECYSPVVGKDTLRMLLSIAAAKNLRIYTADVTAAFLQAPLDQKIYMKCPEGYESHTQDGEEEVLELHNAIYGLHQSSAAFWTVLHQHLIAKGFHATLGDPCLFYKNVPGVGPVYCATYVDDIVYCVPTDAAAADFLRDLRERFEIGADQGKPIEFLLGMGVTQDLAAGTVALDMDVAITKLARGLLTPEELRKAEGVHYPMLVTPLPKLDSREVSKEQFDYLSVVGSLLHFSNCVRCDVATAVNLLARHSATPGTAHVNAVKRVVMYLYNTRHLRVVYRRETSGGSNVPVIFESVPRESDRPMELGVFADSDFAADHARRSMQGVVIMMNGGPISWISTLGKTTVLSTCEAEVTAAVTACKEALHLKRLLVDLGLMSESAGIVIAEDNSAAISQAESGIRHIRKAKHYELKLRWLQELVLSKEVSFRYTPTKEQTADLFTKPLDLDSFIRFRSQLMS